MTDYGTIPRPGSWWRLIKAKRFWCFFVAPHIAFGLIALATADPVLIVVLNLAKIALAVMVCVAFAPGVFAMLSTDEPLDKESWLIFGIFLSWYGSAYQAGLALAWRYLGEPLWLVNSDLVSYPLFVISIAAVIHVAVPSVIQGVVPASKWVRIGAMVGFAVFLGLLAIYWQDIARTVDRRGPMHDVSPSHAQLQAL